MLNSNLHFLTPLFPRDANQEGYTALLLACLKGHADVAKALVDEKCDLTAETKVSDCK